MVGPIQLLGKGIRARAGFDAFNVLYVINTRVTESLRRPHAVLSAEHREWSGVTGINSVRIRHCEAALKRHSVFSQLMSQHEGSQLSRRYSYRCSNSVSFNDPTLTGTCLTELVSCRGSHQLSLNPVS